MQITLYLFAGIGVLAMLVFIGSYFFYLWQETKVKRLFVGGPVDGKTFDVPREIKSVTYTDAENAQHIYAKVLNKFVYTGIKSENK